MRSKNRAAWRLLALAATFALVATAMFATVGVALAANPAVDLDQCRNGALAASGDQGFEQCKNNTGGTAGWVNGNAGASNAHYAEGESISYRARLSNIPVGASVHLIVGYDVVHSGVHAIDYLTDKNRWQQPETDSNTTPDLPVSGVNGVSATPKHAHIPAPTTNIDVDVSRTLANGCGVADGTGGSGYISQPVTSYNALDTAGVERMEFFGATPAGYDNNNDTSTTAISYTGDDPNLLNHGGDEEQQVAIDFTADVANPVLAWGGHIASRLDWGCLNAPQSASGISGSPYHMRIESMTVNGKLISIGNQDRSLSAAAVIFVQPTFTTQVKNTNGTSATSDDTNIANNGHVTIGTVAYDTATLGGAFSTAGGTVQYYVEKGDSSCTASGATDLGLKTVTNAVAPASNTYTFPSAGTYYFWAVYSGDANNGGATSDCTSEIVVVDKVTPTVATTQSLIPNDTLTLSSATSDASGSVDFYLFAPGATCSAANIANAAYTEEDVALVSNNHASTSNDGVVANGGYTATTQGTYKWLAIYSGDDNNNGVTSNCIEQFTLDNDINN